MCVCLSQEANMRAFGKRIKQEQNGDLRTTKYQGSHTLPETSFLMASAVLVGIEKVMYSRPVLSA